MKALHCKHQPASSQNKMPLVTPPHDDDITSNTLTGDSLANHDNDHKCMPPACIVIKEQSSRKKKESKRARKSLKTSNRTKTWKCRLEEEEKSFI